VVSALRLPTMARSCPGIGELFPLMMNYIATYADLTTEYSFLVAAFVLTTWFADRLSVVPYLAVCGPPGSGKTTLLRLLHCLCRRAIHASAITPASLCRLAAQVRPRPHSSGQMYGQPLPKRW
jgi:ABC-type Na+ transport system ATPase subunit NatA